MWIRKPKSSTEDAELLRRCACGDDDAFAVLNRRHLNAVLAFLRPRVSDPEVAFDLAAETFATVALNARSYRGDGPVAGWPETRAALLSRIVDERPYADIATDLACSEQVVRQRVHRGLRQLRSAMED